MSSWNEVVREVTRRAGERCEYCLMHQSLQGATFHVEHIIPKSLDGPSAPSNLALACPGCNLRKADAVQAQDAQSGEFVPMFNPRVQRWNEHFAWNGLLVVGVSATGRATIERLEMNHPRRIKIREVEQLVGLFPSEK